MSRRTSESDKAIRLAWKRERELVLSGLGTRDWTLEQQQSIIEKGKAYDENGVAFQGHHMKSAEKYPEYQGNPDNIQFLTKEEHLAAHDGFFQNPTNGFYNPDTCKTKIFNEGFEPCHVIRLSKPIIMVEDNNSSSHTTEKKTIKKKIVIVGNTNPSASPRIVSNRPCIQSATQTIPQSSRGKVVIVGNNYKKMSSNKQNVGANPSIEISPNSSKEKIIINEEKNVDTSSNDTSIIKNVNEKKSGLESSQFINETIPTRERVQRFIEDFLGICGVYYENHKEEVITFITNIIINGIENTSNIVANVLISGIELSKNISNMDIKSAYYSFCEQEQIDDNKISLQIKSQG